MVAGPDDADSQRYLAVNANSTPIAAGNVDLTIALIRFAVGPLGLGGPMPKEYTFTLNADDPVLETGLLLADYTPLPLQNGGGTIFAVPEPSTLGMLIPGIVVVGGIVMRRRAMPCSDLKTAA